MIEDVAVSVLEMFIEVAVTILEWLHAKYP